METEKKKKLKRTKTIPVLIEALIKIVREIPFNEEFPVVKDEYLNFELRSVDDIYSIEALDLRDLLQEFLGSLSKDLLEHIWGKNSIPEWSAYEEIKYLSSNTLTLTGQTERAAAEFIEYRLLWNQFKILTQIVDKILENKDSLSEKEIEQMLNQLPIEPKYKFNKRDGTILISFDQFTHAINNTDITLIRECKWCHKIFYAVRSDQKCCSSVNDNKPLLNNEKSYGCKYFYNLKNFGIRKKQKNREERLNKLKEKYKDKEVWGMNGTLVYTDSKSNLSKTKKLSEEQNETPLEITEILLENSETETTYKFFIIELNSKRKGFIEFKYNSRLNDTLKGVFRLKNKKSSANRSRQRAF
jgi:hypothetical protein